MKNKILYSIGIILLVVAIALVLLKTCSISTQTDYDGDSNSEAIMKYENQQNFTEKLDSLEFVETISKQKLQEIYDLGSLYFNTSPQKIDTLLEKQIRSYFYNNDSEAFNYLKKELIDNHVFYTKLQEIKMLERDSLLPDTIGSVNYKINFYNKDKKFIKTAENSMHYILKKNPEKLKSEFKYYIESFGEKDTIRSGVIK